jgi:hypothetical protein
MVLALSLFLIVLATVAGAEGARAGCRRLLTVPRPARRHRGPERGPGEVTDTGRVPAARHTARVAPAR